MTPLDSRTAVVFALTSGVGFLMALSGVQKTLLGWRRRRACPGCRRPITHGRCGCLR